MFSNVYGKKRKILKVVRRKQNNNLVTITDSLGEISGMGCQTNT